MSFDRFESLLTEVGVAFVSMQEKFPTETSCKPGCADCCSAFFDVSLIEAEYIRHGLTLLEEGELQQVKERAKSAKEITRELLKELELKSASQNDSSLVGSWRVRCPLLTDQQQCIIYPYRPVTCRAYGLPTSIGDKGHVCGYSGFAKGQSYPTIKLDQINSYLQALSKECSESKNMADADAHKRFFLYEVALKCL